MALSSSRRFLNAARKAALAAHEKKAREIRLLDVRGFSSVTDFFVLATVDSPPQMRAVEESIEIGLKGKPGGLSPLRREGRGRAWRVLDYGGVVVHLLTEEARSFYGLERLWENAREAPWSAPRRPAGSKTARRKTPGRPVTL